jgi:2,3-bisphosphoglycerate-independent phosphoglycerate mutase
LDLKLRPSQRIQPAADSLLLIVMDGIGVGRGDQFDAVAQARTPTLDWLRRHASYRTLRAHGVAVGLPDDSDMGNSEVGHNAIGAGRIVDQGAKLVNAAIANGSIFEGETWRTITARCQSGGALHLIGLLSDGNVHSHEDHLHALIDAAAQEGFKTLYVHILLDGRDVEETSAPIYVERLEEVLARHDGRDGRRYKIASGGGRMVTTMDRYGADWRVVERGWQAHVHGEGRRFESALQAIETYRAEQPKLIDQYLPPFVVAEAGGDKPVGAMRDGDAVIFFNFRGDRAIELSRAFDEGDDFDAFDRGRRPDVFYAGMMLYDGDLGIPDHYLVSPPLIERTVSEYLARSGVTQLALSETQKYGHVTYFWNGNRGNRFDPDTETWVKIESDRVAFDERPWMKAAEITDQTIAALASGKHRFIRINFPNGDMVGHTGELEATVIAVETVDLCLARILEQVDATGATLIVTADHGNADDMVERNEDGDPKLDEAGQPKSRTSHSLNPVPFYLYRPGRGVAAGGGSASGEAGTVGTGRAASDAGAAGNAGAAAPDGTAPASGTAGGVVATLAPPASPRLRDALPDAGLANLAATVLELLGFAPPDDYEPSLLA